MATIEYRFSDGHCEEIEVSEEFAEEYGELEKNEKRRWWRERKRRKKEVSLDWLAEKGVEFPDNNDSNPEDMLFKKDKSDLDFRSCLTDYQYRVADMRFNKHMTCKEIADDFGISTAAVSRLLKKCIKKIYKAFSIEGECDHE